MTSSGLSFGDAPGVRELGADMVPFSAVLGSVAVDSVAGHGKDVSRAIDSRLLTFNWLATLPSTVVSGPSIEENPIRRVAQNASSLEIGNQIVFLPIHYTRRERTNAAIRAQGVGGPFKVDEETLLGCFNRHLQQINRKRSCQLFRCGCGELQPLEFCGRDILHFNNRLAILIKPIPAYRVGASRQFAQSESPNRKWQRQIRPLILVIARPDDARPSWSLRKALPRRRKCSTPAAPCRADSPSRSSAPLEAAKAGVPRSRLFLR